jgi:hypothetical protein
MNTMLALAGALGLFGWPGIEALAEPTPAPAPLRRPEIYQRATRQFAEANLLKPSEPKTNHMAFTLAPLILQEVNPAQGSPAQADRFGTLSLSNGVLLLDTSRPAIYWQADSVQLRGRACARFSYLWCYSLNRSLSTNGQSTNTLLPEGAASALALQGIRITLNSAGQPIIWEVLAGPSEAKLIFVSQSLEAAAATEYGTPLPGRRYAIEARADRSLDSVVPRVIDDGPVPMGPIVYLSAGTREVSTLICRCMSAQAKKLLTTRTYDLLRFQGVSTNSLIAQAKALSRQPTAFWPADHLTEPPLDRCLRLPDAGLKGW